MRKTSYADSLEARAPCRRRTRAGIDAVEQTDRVEEGTDENEGEDERN